MGENGGFGMLHLVGFNTDVKTPLRPPHIPSTHPRHFLPYSQYKKSNPKYKGDRSAYFQNFSGGVRNRVRTMFFSNSEYGEHF